MVVQFGMCSQESVVIAFGQLDELGDTTQALPKIMANEHGLLSAEEHGPLRRGLLHGPSPHAMSWPTRCDPSSPRPLYRRDHGVRPCTSPVRRNHVRHGHGYTMVLVVLMAVRGLLGASR